MLGFNRRIFSISGSSSIRHCHQQFLDGGKSVGLPPNVPVRNSSVVFVQVVRLVVSVIIITAPVPATSTLATGEFKPTKVTRLLCLWPKLIDLWMAACVRAWGKVSQLISSSSSTSTAAEADEVSHINDRQSLFSAGVPSVRSHTDIETSVIHWPVHGNAAVLAIARVPSSASEPVTSVNDSSPAVYTGKSRVWMVE